MATTRLGVRNRVREMLGDQNPDERQVSKFRYDGSISRNMFLIAARAQMPRSAVQSISLVANTYEYTSLTSTPQIVSGVFLTSTGNELKHVVWEQFNAYYRQDSSSPRAPGTPAEYTIRESLAAGLVVRVGPTPDESDTLKLHMSILPAALATDSTSIPFSEELTRVLDSMVAAEIVATLSEDKLKALGVPRSAADAWMAQAERGIRDYNLRQLHLGARQNRILRRGGRRGAGGGLGDGSGGWGSGWGE